jgi:cyclase
MLANRVVVCLDVQGGRVVKGVSFQGLRDVGDPAALAAEYESAGADELVFLDVAASTEERTTLLDVVRHTAERLYIPLTVGGGIRDADDVAASLRAGADKVSINSAAVQRPRVLSESAERFGSQCVVASIDARRTAGDSWTVYTHGGRRPTLLDAAEWAERCVSLGAGEILLTSIDRDGRRSGYDLELTRTVASRVNVPVIASGGAGSAQDVVDVLRDGGADAALVAGVLHDGSITVQSIKEHMATQRIPVRRSTRD